MARITVRHAVAAAYGLLFGHPLTVLGLTWLPGLVYLFGATYLIQHMTGVTAQFVPTTAGQFAHYAYLLYSLGLLVATAAFGALIAVPLTRQAFGLREESVAAHLVVTHREFKMFLALLRYYAFVVIGAVIFALIAGILISQSDRYASLQGELPTWAGIPLEGWLNFGGGALAALILAAYTVRYGFFLDAIAAVEDHVRLGRARGLSQGNFARLLAVTLIVGAPATALLLASEKTFGGLSLALAPNHALLSAALLTLGLVVLHALFAGAAASVYSEMAEAHVQEEASHYEPAAHFEPAAVFAASTSEHSEETYERVPPEAIEVIPQMEIATPEANGAADTMAPDGQSESGPDNARLQEGVGEQPGIMATYARREVEETKSSLDASNGYASPRFGGENESAHSDELGEKISGHAQNAELPAPPLDPAGAMSASEARRSLN